MVRCPKCTKLDVRDKTRCECGHVFDGSEPDATPTQADAAEWRRHAEANAALAPSPGSAIGIRVTVLLLAFTLVVLAGPALVQINAGSSRQWSGSLMPYLVIPILFGVLWLVFSVASIGTLLVRDGSRISPLACIGIGLLLALAGTFLIFALRPPIPPYGHGP